MKTMRTYLLLLSLLCCMTTSAQKHLTVVDIETLIPVNGANVVANGLTAQTDSMGCITVPDSCHTLVFSHVNYESRIINQEEVRDTVYMIS